MVVPSTFPKELEKQEVSYTLFNFSRGNESVTGRWAQGPSMDGMGVFNYVENPAPCANKPKLKPVPPYIHDTLPTVLRGSNELIPPSLD